MSPVLLVQRLVRAGLTPRAIERKCGFSRSKVSRLIEGNASLTAAERDTLEEFAAGVLPPAAMASPHHERCAPRYGR
ncbi:hypothetical protein IB277_06800 [Ensifer sp. ENS07]|uniref:hypothetical protein n=1 Tax=Ensifer sp. ENS07 TaxID=2769274 RepID=UPI001781513C|nr:hypothetical protein [Ensifer sp. ENS07]MBD9636001.1 hypothetical protein [Ensifer sp. ENS07]